MTDESMPPTRQPVHAVVRAIPLVTSRPQVSILKAFPVPRTHSNRILAVDDVDAQAEIPDFVKFAEFADDNLW
jgi:hypothetical protein